MANTEEHSSENTETLPPPAPPVEQHQTPSADVEQGQTPTATVVKMTKITKSWKREDLYKNGSLALRAMGLLFSFLALIIMATNKHYGDNFTKYEEYSYLLAIAVISAIYTGGQVYLQVHEILTGVQTFSRKNMVFFNFIGDQIVAYLLISAGSAAAPVTDSDRERENSSFEPRSFTDSAAAAIAMTFLAFFALALSALVSGYKLSNRSYI
ncbi:CASP-like protein 4B1 [Apium graveolens]|uniref:CASP-like protein 4B1 n=1 Tax=Apium graveolens TaxID=4045 RepID=UPI003D7BBA86